MGDEYHEGTTRAARTAKIRRRTDEECEGATKAARGRRAWGFGAWGVGGELKTEKKPELLGRDLGAQNSYLTPSSDVLMGQASSACYVGSSSREGQLG